MSESIELIDQADLDSLNKLRNDIFSNENPFNEIKKRIEPYLDSSTEEAEAELLR